MKVAKFYILFFDYSGNELHQQDAVRFISEHLRSFYLRNLMIPLANNTFLVREDNDHSIDLYIDNAISELSEEMAMGLSVIKQFLIPVELSSISAYIEPWLKEIEVMKQIQ